jgi:predicted nucleotidyltransferase
VLRDRVVPLLRQYFAAEPRGVIAAYLFGSVARAEERPDSDVDVAVLLRRHRVLDLADLERCAVLQDDIAALVGRPVDLVPLDGAAPDLRFRVLRDRVLLFDGDAAQRIEFEIQARNEYYDLLPHLEQYRRTVLGRA